MATGPQSNLAPPAGYTASDEVFNDNFSGTTLDQYWHPYITSNAAQGYPWNTGGSSGSSEGGPGTFVADYDLPSHVSVDNGLTLTTTKQSFTTADGGTYSYTGGSGRDSHFAQVATASPGSLQQSPHSLTRPLH
jgi:hypothetical protein